MKKVWVFLLVVSFVGAMAGSILIVRHKQKIERAAAERQKQESRDRKEKEAREEVRLFQEKSEIAERVVRLIRDLESVRSNSVSIRDGISKDLNEFEEIVSYGMRIQGRYVFNEEVGYHHPSVEEVFVGGPADLAGIKPGTIIHRIDKIASIRTAKRSEQLSLRVAIEDDSGIRTLPLMQARMWALPQAEAIKKMMAMLNEKDALAAKLFFSTMTYELEYQHYVLDGRLLDLSTEGLLSKEHDLNEVIEKLSPLSDRIQKIMADHERLFNSLPKRTFSQ